MRHFHRVMLLATIGLVGACSVAEGDGLRVPAPNSIPELLGSSDGFVIASFDDRQETSLEALGGDPKIEDQCRLAADLQLQSDPIMAWDFEYQSLKIASFCDRCFGEETSTCAMPEWHYLVPSESGRQYAVFFSSNYYNQDLPNFLVALFEIEDGQVDMTPLPDGELVAVEDMEAYLQAFNTDPDNRSFFP